MEISPNALEIDAPGELATDGNIVYPNMSAVAYGYDATNTYLTTAAVVQYGKTYLKTFTYNGNNKISGESLWVPQS